jgi:hypothetical protein
MPPRSIVCRFRAVRVESRGHRCGERVTALDHQVNQEPLRTRGHDEIVETPRPYSTDISITYCMGLREQLDGI